MGEATQVLARFDGAYEQQILLGKLIHRPHPCEVEHCCLFEVDTQGHVTQAIGRNSGNDAIVHRRLRTAQHKVGIALGEFEASLEDANAVTRELVGTMQESEVMQRNNQRMFRGARDQRCGVHNIDWTGGRLSLGPIAAQPRLVQPGRTDGEFDPGNGWRPIDLGAVPMSSSETDQFDSLDTGQSFGGAQRSDTGATRHPMPTLLEGISDAHGHHHARSERGAAGHRANFRRNRCCAPHFLAAMRALIRVGKRALPATHESRAATAARPPAALHCRARYWRGVSLAALEAGPR